MRASVRLDAPEIAAAGAAELDRVGIEDLAPRPVAGQRELIVDADTREVEGGRDRVATARGTQESDDVLRGIVLVDPFEAGRIVIELPKGAVLAIQATEFYDEGMDARVLAKLRQPPIEPALLAPLG